MRKTATGDYVAVNDVPLPAVRRGGLLAGDLVLNRIGERLVDSPH